MKNQDIDMFEEGEFKNEPLLSFDPVVALVTAAMIVFGIGLLFIIN